MKYLRKILGVLGLIAIFVVANVIVKIIFAASDRDPSVNQGSDYVNDFLQEAIDTTNKSLPRMIDSETRFDTSYLSNGAINYKYSLVNYSSDLIDPREFKNMMRPSLLNNLCTSEDMQFIRSNDISVIYHYYGKQGRIIAKIPIAMKSCLSY
jgi:hypothetical protein